MPRRGLHELHASIGDLCGERSCKAIGIHRIRLDGDDEARAVLQRDSREGSEVRANVDDNVATPDRDLALLVDSADRLFERQKVEFASITFAAPETTQRRFPHDATRRGAITNGLRDVEAPAPRPSRANPPHRLGPA